MKGFFEKAGLPAGNIAYFRSWEQGNPGAKENQLYRKKLNEFNQRIEERLISMRPPRSPSPTGSVSWTAPSPSAPSPSPNRLTRP